MSDKEKEAYTSIMNSLYTDTGLNKAIIESELLSILGNYSYILDEEVGYEDQI